MSLLLQITAMERINQSVVKWHDTTSRDMRTRELHMISLVNVIFLQLHQHARASNATVKWRENTVEICLLVIRWMKPFPDFNYAIWRRKWHELIAFNLSNYKITTSKHSLYIFDIKLHNHGFEAKYEIFLVNMIQSHSHVIFN